MAQPLQERVGQALCYYVLKVNGRYIAQSTVRPIVNDNYLKYPTLRDEMKEFETRIKEHVGMMLSSSLR